MPFVKKELCPQDHPCPVVKMCPTGAVTQQGFRAPDIDSDRCIDCGICTQYCPYGVFRDAAYNGERAAR